jgi:hypothetical protein
MAVRRASSGGGGGGWQWVGRALRFEAGDQFTERYMGEGWDLEVGVGKVVVLSRRAGTDYGVEVSAFGGEAAGVGVLEGHRFVAAQAEAV